MPTITRGGGPSDKADLAYTYDVDRAAARLRAAAPATAEPVVVGEDGPEHIDLPDGGNVVPVTTKGGEQPSPDGSNSSTSSPKTSSSSENTETPSRKRARGAGNRSNKATATSGTARLATTNTRATTSESDDE